MIAWWDTEANGLLNQATKVHCLAAKFSDGTFISCADQPGYMPIREGLERLSLADIRVGHNSHDYDERLVRRHYPLWQPKPGSRIMDTLLISRLLFPRIGKQAPNNHKVPPKYRNSHNLKSWGYRLGEHKAEYDGGWEEWSPTMQTYMDQDVATLYRLFVYLMSCKPSPEAVTLEHDFAAIIRRQEAWGFTFDADGAADLAAELQDKARALEFALVEKYGEWWAPDDTVTVKASRKVKLPQFAPITLRRFSPTTGKELKPYTGPPLADYEEGAEYTPISRVTFQPSSREHVRKVLHRDHGWKPIKFNKVTPTQKKAGIRKGSAMEDDDVLRALPWPDAHDIAELYLLEKLLGYVSKGKGAWLKTMVQEGSVWRQHGRVNTLGTYTFRCSHSDPNLGQVPVRHPEYGKRCRGLFIARLGFELGGYDGSGMQLRLMAHYMARFDGGKFVQVFERDEDPHAFMRDTVGTDIAGEGDDGRDKGKRVNYALPFGAGDFRLGSIMQPTSTDPRKKEIGALVRDRLKERLNGLEELKQSLTTAIENKGGIRGLDGRFAHVDKPHHGLSTLLQMGEGVVMKKALVILDGWLKERGLVCGVNEAGLAFLDQADYEFAANVHDEAQADIRPKHRALFKELSERCVAEAGVLLKLRCPLKSQAKFGPTWRETH